MAEYAKKKNIRKPRPETIQHADKGDFRKKASSGGGIHAGKSKDKIAKEKSLVTKQNIKEKEKASTKKEKKDLDAAHKRVTGGGIHAGKSPKGKDVEIKKKTKKKSIISKIKDYFDADKDKPGFQFTKSKKAKAAEVKKKPLSPEQKKKDKAIMKAEEARRKKAKSKANAKAKSEKAKKDSALIMKAEKKRRAEGKKDIPTGRSAAASGYVKREDAAARKKHVLGTLKDKPSGRK